MGISILQAMQHLFLPEDGGPLGRVGMVVLRVSSLACFVSGGPTR